MKIDPHSSPSQLVRRAEEFLGVFLFEFHFKIHFPEIA